MIPTLDVCKPGLRPTHYNVLIAIDTHEEVTKGGIILTSSTRDRDDSAAERGRVVAVSPMAFKGGDWIDDCKPAVGDVVLFKRYAGNLIDGADGLKYRIMTDEEIRGIADGNPAN